MGVVLENQTVVDHGIRIVIFFDGDKYAWNDLSFWLKDFPQVFKTPAVESHRAYHRESKAVLIAKVKGERRSSSSHLHAMRRDVSWAAHMYCSL